MPITADALAEVERVLALWGELRRKTAETLRGAGEEDRGFLFGEFGIADAFFWPVLWVSFQLDF